MKIAIVGGTGAFGLALGARLVEAGDEVVIGSRDAERAREKAQEVGAAAGAANEEAVRLLRKHRASLDRIAAALLEKETLVREELQAIVEDVEPESRASETVGVPRVVASEPGELPA